MKPTILLSYDVEEFDMPMEYGGQLPFERQLAISTGGLNRLLSILDQRQVKCTFYCTAQYALHRKELIRQLHQQGHEIASHGYYHSSFQVADLKSSREVLEEIVDHKVHGYRMARMMPLAARDVAAAGYAYNSSLNPTWLPGRYNNLDKPRKPFREDGILQFPASVTPFLRMPLFWLSFHNLPLSLYLQGCKRVLASDGYANLYFHPWEFMDYAGEGGAKFPGYVTRNTGKKMEERTARMIDWAQDRGYAFAPTRSWLAGQKLIEL